MTRQEMADLLNGREYGEEISSAEERVAKASNLLVVFGASDDLCELRGVIHDEVGACDGVEFRVSKDGKLIHKIEPDEREVLEKHGVLRIVEEHQKQGIWIGAAWNYGGYSWYIRAEVPHSKFDIMEDDDKFCSGIVLDLKELQ